jgi:PKD repeat protein
MAGAIRRLRALVVFVTTIGLSVGLLLVGAESAAAAPAPVLQPPATAVTADRLPTVQINGVVWSQAVVGNTVYAGGSFANARPAGAAPGTNLTARGNLLAYDITTGNLVTSFAPNLNGQVLSVAASPDGSRIYVVGDFTTANGVARRRVAAYSTATGQLITSFNPSGVNSQARAVIATNDTVYVGGGFAGTGDGSLRNNLAAFRASDGGLLPWNPNADYTVWALAISGDGSSVFAGGSFRNVGGQPAYGLAKISGTGTGPLDTSWQATNTVRNAGPDAGISSLRIQGSFLYGTTWHFGPGGNLEGTFKAPVGSGVVEWVTDCHGDVYSSFMSNGIVYTAGHAHYCGNMGGGFPQYSAWRFQHAMAWTDSIGGEILNDVHGYPNWHGVKPGPSIVNWLPDMAMGTYTGQSQAGWNVVGNNDYIAFGGEFPSVNNVGQQGLVRFARKPIAPAQEGPRFVNNSIVPRLVPTSTTSVRVSWPAGYDRDDYTLTYRAIRNGAFNTPRYTTDANSNWWTLPSLGFVDTGLTPGATYSYQIVVNDPNGNTVYGASASVTMPTSMTAANAYTESVRGNGARIYWPLNETSGLTITDRAAAGAASSNIGVTDGRGDTGVTWNQAGAIPGDSAASLGDNDWSRVFAGNCAATAGCQWGTETGPDTFTTQVWIRTTTNRGGRIFGFGDLQNGNSGHRDRHIYMNNAGRLIFGVRAQNGNLRTLVSTRSYNDGQWHMVTATMSPAGMVLYVDAAAVAQRADITQGEAYLGYWRLGGDNLNGWPNTPTTRNFIGTVDEVAVYPTALTQSKINAQYEASGRGVPAPNQAPVAAFTSSTTDLKVNVDGSGSDDPDGTIADYAWEFGDGDTASGATTSHTYATAGTYTIKLTVTDNDGDADSVTHSVTVSAPDAIAADTFDRTFTNGWGAADTGGTWTISGGGSNFAVANGAGSITVAASSGPSAYLNSVSARDVDITTSLSYDKPGTGGGIYTSVVARRIGTSDYRLKVRATATATTLYLSRLINGTETVLASQTVTGLVYAPGDTWNLRFQAEGTGTTTLRAKIWKSTDSEPTAWTVASTDTTAALQNPGAVGIYSFLSSTATNSPITLSVRDFEVQPTP